MDLNYIYQRHQVSLFKATHTVCPDARRAHREMADQYAVLIEAAKNGPRAAVA
jgi:hypothetical protein